MKGIKRILSYCTAVFMLGIPYAHADDSADAIARAATRRDATTTVVRQNSESHADTPQITTTSGISRATNITNTGTNVRSRETSSVTTRDNVVVRDGGTRNTTNGTTQSVSARTTSNVMSRGATTSGKTISVPSRAATIRGNTTSVSRTGNLSSASVSRGVTTSQRTSNMRSDTSSQSRSALSRAATTQPVKSGGATSTARRTVTGNSSRVARAGVTAEEIMNRDYTQCREVYYSCMDEFCANKDSQLKRCACSSRVNEFDNVKAQLAEVEDKLLDFNQRLLTVNMDKEDAESIYQATEGELAFNQEDKSKSKELLDEISEKLNSTFDTSSFDSNLAPISLSLNAAAAFDSVDSLAGASTTSKTGTELYSAALPICREMALEVCTQDELDIVESGYQMAIEQDCNTVSKAYQTQQDLAREKIREGSALLDISRLDIYQERNSDDILTCKKKMLDMLTDTAVCGTNLQKCLDISGQYIDPSTGEAILTSNLVNLGSLITRPEANQTWTGAPGNAKFVSYLNSKKMYLEAATENCQDIADYVWDAFIEDALAQIKLAQENKLEEVRQSCTTLTTQCLTESAESIEEFDARALSIFGVEADKTVKQMCAEVQTACTALLDSVDGGTDWNAGMTEIATDKTYETILQTCREVGRACIIQSCKSISGNFGLCEDIQTSVNRKAIINRTACWDEVMDCVASAGIDAINQITTQESSVIDTYNGSFYPSTYGVRYTTNGSATYDITNDELVDGFAGKSCIISEENEDGELVPSNTMCIYDLCANECGFDTQTGLYSKSKSDECQVCRITEQIWGNCEAHPASNLSAANSHNQILTDGQETLLSWFAKNTNTDDAIDSCRDTSCGPGFIPQWDAETQTSTCVSEANLSDDGEVCPANNFWRIPITLGENSYENCCKAADNTAGGRDGFGNCCLGKLIDTDNVDWDGTSPYWNTGLQYTGLGSTGVTVTGTIPEGKDGGLCMPDNAEFVVAFQPSEYYTVGGEADDAKLAFLFCVGSMASSDNTDTYPGGQTLTCKGSYIIVTANGKYITPQYDESNVAQYPASFYRAKEEVSNAEFIRNFKDATWSWCSSNDGTSQCVTDIPKNMLLEYRSTSAPGG